MARNVVMHNIHHVPTFSGLKRVTESKHDKKRTTGGLAPCTPYKTIAVQHPSWTYALARCRSEHEQRGPSCRYNVHGGVQPTPPTPRWVSDCQLSMRGASYLDILRERHGNQPQNKIYLSRSCCEIGHSIFFSPEMSQLDRDARVVNWFSRVSGKYRSSNRGKGREVKLLNQFHNSCIAHTCTIMAQDNPLQNIVMV